MANPRLLPKIELETANAVSGALDSLLKAGHSPRAVSYSALGIVQAIIDELDGRGAAARACAQLGELDN